jgi:hypothetical protein
MALNVTRFLSISGVLTGALLLSGCTGSDVSRAFGLERSVPDEYTVTTRAPLSMPPSEELAAPNAHAAGPQNETPRLQALETLSPDVALHGTAGAPSAGQSALVGQATNASGAPNKGELGAAGAGFVDQLMFWNGGKSGSVVDGDAENRRLKQDSALGRDATSGVTPTVNAKKSSFLGIF